MVNTGMVLGIMVFYIAVFTFIGLAGISIAGDVITPPENTIISQIAYMFRITGFSLTEIIPLWLNTILFLPLGIILGYEVIARLIRGS